MTTSVRLEGNMFVVRINGCQHKVDGVSLYILRDQISEELEKIQLDGGNCDVYAAYEANGW